MQMFYAQDEGGHGINDMSEGQKWCASGISSKRKKDEQNLDIVILFSCSCLLLGDKKTFFIY